MTTDNFSSVFFQTKPCLSAHVLALQTEHPEKYTEELRFLCGSGTFAIVSGAVRARVIAALHISSEHTAVEALLGHCEATDISKALVLLDRPRLARQLGHKIRTIEDRNPHVAAPVVSEEENNDGMDSDGNEDEKKKKRRKRRKVDEYRRKKQAVEAELREDDHDWSACLAAHEDTAVQELIQSASVSGALSRKVRNWAKASLPSDFLEFVLLTLPAGPWRTMADLVHFKPSDFSVPYFLDEIHKDSKENASEKKEETECEDVVSTESTERNFVMAMRELVKNASSADIDQQFFNIAEEFPQVNLAYSFIRTQPSLMSRPSVMEHLAARAPLDTVIWYYEEFHRASRKCEGVVSERLHGGTAEEVLARISGARSKATYGKLVERILTFRGMGLSFADDLVPVAEARLGRLKSSRTKDVVGRGSKVAVFGDASCSMQAAIEAATIFAGMASACFDGELSFFRSQLVRSPYEKPGNVRETLEVCNKIRANSCTSNAACLWPYYKEKKVMDLFVMVTDEIENTPCHGHMFGNLFAKYLREVNPNAKLVIVCVGKRNHTFRQSLTSRDVEYKTVYIDESRPDLAKFDALLGQLAMVSSQGDESRKKTREEMEFDSCSDADDFVLVDD